MRRAITWQLIFGVLIIGGWIVLGVAAPLITPADPLKSTTLIIDGQQLTAEATTPEGIRRGINMMLERKAIS